ncbi:MAG: 5'-nucleotidase C-terminal domain-containing protein [Firmicutes bacterium]|nr:5'-nucleotidase C-terminal domain-containing protein [Bacillota bacterium]
MKHMKKLLSLLLVLCLVLSLSCTAFAAGAEKPLDGKTVILHSNDVHGAIDLYAAMAALKADYEAQGAEVILADAGDYSQGTVYVSVNKGADAVTMMNATGYDVVTLGNHEFDYGYAQLAENMKAAKFQVLCADVLGADGKTIYDANTIIEKGGVKIGFFGLETPEAQTKANPKLIQGLKFLAGADGKELYNCAAAQVADLKAKGADLVVCLAHLGVDESSEPYTSYDLAKNVQGIDFIIDGHSHTVMTAGPNGEPIQSTGTAFANIGVITIDNATKKIESNELKAIWHKEKIDGKSVTVVDYKTRDEKVAAAAKAIIDPIDKAYGEKFAVSEVALNGAKAPNGNRDSETNLGDLITDAMLWKVLADAEITVPEENVVAITNGGGIRASIGVGDVTKKDINTVLPFGNTLAVVYVKGSELLEALEASTYCTPESIGGFPQVAGMQFTVATYETYDKNDESYPNSTYYGPKTINRVTIGSINGKDFDPEATYAVITNNFVAGGGDTYYAFAAATNQFDTGLPLDEVVMEYITKELKGVIGETYAEPAGRIVVDQGVAPAIADVQSMVMGEASYTAESYKAYAAVEAKLAAAKTEAERVALCAELRAAVSGLKIVENTFDDATSGWYKPAVDFAQASGLMSGMGDNKFAPDVTTTRAMVAQVMYELADEPDVSDLTCPLSDVDSTAWYADAVTWAYNAGVVSGYEDGTFRPGRAITRQEMAVMFYGMLFGTDSILVEDDIKIALGAFKDGDTVASWAREAVAVCYISGIMVGDNGSFKPTDLLSRAQLAQVFRSFYETQLTFVLNELPAAPDQPSTPEQPSVPEQPSMPTAA